MNAQSLGMDGRMHRSQINGMIGHAAFNPCIAARPFSVIISGGN
jgi:hypothetical protein